MAEHDCTDNAATRWVAGVDGCRGGWIVVLRPVADASAAYALLLHTFAEVLAVLPAAETICVDMPIGLPAVKGRGGRVADSEARAMLGRRKASVFSVPSREAVMQTTYADACEVASRTSEPSRKVAKQCFNLFPKMREIDALMSPDLQARVYESHPELAFWALNGECPLDEPKKARSGVVRRQQLLEAAGYDGDFLRDRSQYRARDVGLDDLLDAAVCSWTASRIARGVGRRFPAAPSLDAKGLRMEIWG